MKGKFYTYIKDDEGEQELIERPTLQEAKNYARTAIESGLKKVLILRCVTVATAKASAAFGSGE